MLKEKQSLSESILGSVVIRPCEYAKTCSKVRSLMGIPGKSTELKSYIVLWYYDIKFFFCKLQIFSLNIIPVIIKIITIYKLFDIFVG